MRPLAFVFILIFVSACISTQAGESMKKEISFEAIDGVKIAADFYDSKSSAGVLLVHMMPAIKESWKDFAGLLQKNNFKVLAIDLRGHGKSEFGPNGYLSFTDAEHQKGIGDVEAGVKFLRENGAEKISIVGASIGANLALQFANENEIASAVLLSPGLNYRGVDISEISMPATKNIFLVASKDDEYSAESAQKIFGNLPAGENKKIKIYEAAGHGTDMFSEKDLMGMVLKFIKNNG